MITTYTVRVYKDEDGYHDSTRWILNGELHREDGPAYINAINGDQAWYFKGKEHREDGPAIESTASGYKAWFKNGKRHREDGPAILWSNGSKKWYLNGINYSEEDYWKEINKSKVKEMTIEEIEKLLGHKVKVIGEK